MSEFKYLAAYPEHILQQIEQLQQENRLGQYILQRYPKAHDVRNNKALYAYVMEIKNDCLKKSPPLSKIIYDDKVKAQNALGTHSRVSRVQGGKLKAKKEIRIDDRFKLMPEEFLRMIVVHELAHIKEMDHNKAFYSLCRYMEPDYHQLELDLRIYLTYLDTEPSLYR